VAFGGDGPTAPLAMNDEGSIHQNLGSQQVRLVRDVLPRQQLCDPQAWIYQYRNGADREWNSFYSFVEVEFFLQDFEVMNWWASAHTLHRRTVLAVRFLRDGEPVKLAPNDWAGRDHGVSIAGKVMLVNNVIKLNLGGKTHVVHRLESEKARVDALYEYFGIRLTAAEADCIHGWDMALHLPN
jgi:arylamine N-acetyltransferase